MKTILLTIILSAFLCTSGGASELVRVTLPSGEVLWVRVDNSEHEMEKKRAAAAADRVRRAEEEATRNREQERTLALIRETAKVIERRH